jgi:hypothetical protein
MAGELRGKHTTIVEKEVLKWLLKHGDVSIGPIDQRRSNHKIITIKSHQDKGWITIKVMSSVAQELKYFHDEHMEYPWKNDNIPKQIRNAFTIHLSLQD